jgi:magnesium transporter
VKRTLEIEALVQNGRWTELAGILERLSRAELMELYSEMDKADFILVFRQLHKDEALSFFESLDSSKQAKLVSLLDDPEVLQLVEGLDPDDIGRLFEELPAVVTKRLLAVLEPATRTAVNDLLGYPEGSAGRIMTPRYVETWVGQTVGEVLLSLHDSPLDPWEMRTIFVIDGVRIFRGYVHLGSLIKAEPDLQIEALAEDPDIIVRTTDPKTVAADLILDHDIPEVAVVDSEKRLVGVVTFDDVMDVVEMEATKDFHRMGWVSHVEDSIRDASIPLLYRKRISWLMVLVVVNVISGISIAYFEGIIQAVIVLVFFLPLLIASGGNAGSQSSTLIVRSLATGDVQMKDLIPLFGKEIGVALAISLTLGLAVAVPSYFLVDKEVAIVVGLAMVSIVLLGSLFGLLLPFILTKLGLDPATASAPLVTSVADTIGVLVYFGIATWYLGLI